MQVERQAAPGAVITVTLCGEEVVISARLHSMCRAADRLLKTAVIAAATFLLIEVAKAVLDGRIQVVRR